MTKFFAHLTTNRTPSAFPRDSRSFGDLLHTLPGQTIFGAEGFQGDGAVTQAPYNLRCFDVPRRRICSFYSSSIKRRTMLATGKPRPSGRLR
jgi:hypothetical protein